MLNCVAVFEIEVTLQKENFFALHILTQSKTYWMEWRVSTECLRYFFSWTERPGTFTQKGINYVTQADTVINYTYSLFLLF